MGLGLPLAPSVRADVQARGGRGEQVRVRVRVRVREGEGYLSHPVCVLMFKPVEAVANR